jgi:phage gp16-like protein
MSRTAMLAKVHIAKKELRIDDDAYRAMLKREVGKISSGDCTDAELRKLLDGFRRLGWTQKHKRPLSEKAHVRLIYAIWGDIKPLLDGAAGDGELRSFVARQTRDRLRPQGVSAPEFLDAADATKVIEGLKGWLARLRDSQPEGAA